MLSQQGLQMGLDPVLLQSGIGARSCDGIVQDLADADLQRVAVAAP